MYITKNLIIIVCIILDNLEGVDILCEITLDMCPNWELERSLNDRYRLRWKLSFRLSKSPFRHVWPLTPTGGPFIPTDLGRTF